MHKRNLFIPILLCLAVNPSVLAAEEELSNQTIETDQMVIENQVKDGWNQEEDGWYYYQNGEKYRGWLFDKASLEWYYFQEDGKMLQNQMADVEGSRYLFTRSGAMLRGWNDYQGDYYFADRSGNLQKGWLYDEAYQNWYHFDGNGRMESSKFIDSNGYKHLLSDSGRLVIGWDSLGNDYYYGDKNGALYRDGWLYDEAYDGWYYFDKSCRMERNRILTSNGNKYLVTNSGKLAIGWGEYHGDYYYGDSSGAFKSGWLYDVDSGKWYFLDNSGKMQRNQLLHKASNDYLLLPSGEMLKGIGFFQGKTYFGDQNGYLQKGLVNDGKYTYFIKENQQLLTGWSEDNYHKYYFKPNGVRATSWQYIDDKWYYFNKDGQLQTGWIMIPDLGVEVLAAQDGSVDISKTKLNKVEKVIEWYETHIDEVEYSMDEREGPDSYDCSSALYTALWEAGLETKIEWLGNTETLFKEKGHLLTEINTQDVRRGDIFISGFEGNSLGAGGHTGVAYTDTSIIHCSWGANGIWITPIKGYAGPADFPLRWFRIQKY